MKELEKTQRLSIATVLTILVILIGLLSYKKPKHIYHVNSKEALEKIASKDYFVSFDKLNTADFILIDVRNPNDYERGHIADAINIYTPELLSDSHTKIIKKINKMDKTMLLYGERPEDVIAPFMLLYQLGNNNVKILNVENSYFENKLITKNVIIEKSKNDINQFIAASRTKATTKP